MKAKMIKIAIDHKVQAALTECQNELRKSIEQKTSLFPSFRAISFQSGLNGDDFVQNNVTIRIFFEQLNLN